MSPIKPFSMSSSDIQTMSHLKLAEYRTSCTDLPIRKFVLISNMLRCSSEEQVPPLVEGDSEQQWLDRCLDALSCEDEPEHRAATEIHRKRSCRGGCFGPHPAYPSIALHRNQFTQESGFYRQGSTSHSILPGL